MRVVELSPFHEPCGLATYTDALVEGFHHHRVVADVLAPHLEEGIDTWGMPPPRLWSRERATVREAEETYREIRRRAGDVVHLQINLSLFSGRFIAALGARCRLASIPMLATLHGRFGGGWRRNAMMLSILGGLATADVVVHNDAHRDELLHPRVHVIPHGAHRPTYQNLGDAKRALGIDPSRPVLAHIGFLHPHKGILEVLEAVGELRRGPFPDICFLVCGGAVQNGVSEHYLRLLRQRARELDIVDNVRITGRFVHGEELDGQLRAADWIVLNYTWGADQGTSGAARHAMSAGRPIAVSTAPLFDDIRAGVHTMRGPLRTELAQLLAAPSHALQTLARAEDYCEAHTWAQVAQRHLELFEQLQARLRRRRV